MDRRIDALVGVAQDACREALQILPSPRFGRPMAHEDRELYRGVRLAWDEVHLIWCQTNPWPPGRTP